MCGFAASIDLECKGRAIPWALDRLRHRGPDGEGVMREANGNVVLEHCRLAIIDPANREANQPFADPSGRWTIVYNGEIFNYREIRIALERAGVSFRTQSDTEVVLLGFIHEGDRILERLRGMFAFVIFDRQSNDVFAARDPIGVKPFYYMEADGVFVACSELRPLLAYPGFRPTLDPVGVVEFLAFGGNPGQGTLVDGVRKLLPGHCMHIRNRRVMVSEYWDALASEPVRRSPDGAARELLSMLDAAVGAALVSDVPVGLMLSGGIDSSAIAALAARHVAPSKLTAYSVAFGRPDDESDVAVRLAGDLGLKHRVLRVSEEEIRGGFEGWLDDLDYPAGNPTWIALSFIARAARTDGVKVLLSGDGADELFGGYNRWMKYLRFHDWLWSPTPAFARRLAGAATRHWARGLGGDIARRASSGGGLFVPSRPFHDDLLERCLGPVGRATVLEHPPESGIEHLRREFDARRPDADYLVWMSYVSLKTKLVEDFLQRLDKMGMRHSVEGRVPFLDPAITQWALATPQEMMVPGFRQKALLRDAVSSVLPAYVLARPKQGFCPPVGSWCEQLLLDRPVARASPLFEGGLLNAEAVEHLRRRASDFAFPLWAVGVLVEWSQRNLGSAEVAMPEVAAA
jgi:asparagine synthase (glutamine-hydrolysing)